MPTITVYPPKGGGQPTRVAVQTCPDCRGTGVQQWRTSWKHQRLSIRLCPRCKGQP